MTKPQAASAFPPTLKHALARNTGALVDAVISRIDETIDDRHLCDAATRRRLRVGVWTGVEAFVNRLDGAESIRLEPFVAHGRAHRIAGRSIEELLSFYRLGGLAVLEYTRNLPEARALDTVTLLTFTEEVFGFVDEFSAAAAAGFTGDEAAALHGERARRERLYSLLLGEPPTSAETLAAAANAADWPLPERVRVAVGILRDKPPQSAVPSRVIWGMAKSGHCALVVADDDEFERWLERAADSLGLERPIIVSPAVSVERTGYAAARAITLSDLLRAQPSQRGEPRIVRSEDHEIDLLLALDRELSQSLVDRLLAPLGGLDSPARDRMLDTLEAWLANPGRPRAMADQLHLHVQGVRYRLARLRELFGQALDDPQCRFELALAVRVLRSQGREPNPS